MRVKFNDLDKTGMSNSLKEFINSNTDKDGWLDPVFNKEQMEELKVISYSNKETIDIEIKELLHTFEYEDVTKKSFLIECYNNYSSGRTVQAIKALRQVEQFELDFGKCVRFFTLDDIKRYAIEIFNSISYHKVELFITIINQYNLYYNQQAGINERSAWSIVSREFIITLLQENSNVKTLTKRDVKNIFEASDSPQTMIPLVLIFEGVRFKDDEDEDELRYLTEDDLKGNELVVRNRIDVDRTIFIDNNTKAMIEEALNQDAFYVTNEYRPGDIIPIEDSKYIIKRGDTGYASKKSEEGAVAYRTVYKRLNSSREIAKYVVGNDISLTYRNIRKFGMLHYVNSHLVDGYELDEAIERTLKRFGDWSMGDSESDHSNNVQRVRRLRNQFKVHMSISRN